jgi:hypothetical protein
MIMVDSEIGQNGLGNVPLIGFIERKVSWWSRMLMRQYSLNKAAFEAPSVESLRADGMLC